MKRKGSFILICILSLSLSLVFRESIFNNIENKNNFGNKSDRVISSPNALKVDWYRTWGSSEDEFAVTVDVDSLDNIYVSGYNTSHDTGMCEKLCLVKYDNDGELQWERAWGWGEWVYPNRRVIIDSLNNIYLSGGAKNSTGINEVVYLIKFNSSGDLKWEYIWGGNGSTFEAGMALDSLNNIYLIGDIRYVSDQPSIGYLIKFNSQGRLEWNRTWVGGYVSGLSIDLSDNIYITGINYKHGIENDELYLWKYNNTGHLKWNKIVNTMNYSLGACITIDSYDNIYISGSSFNLGEVDIFLMKYDITGEQLWNRTWGGKNDEYAFILIIDSSDNIYVGGEIWGGSFFDKTHWSDMFLVKYNNSGMRLWNQTWDKFENADLSDITIDSFDNTYLAGYTGYEDTTIAIIKYDSSGSLLSCTIWGGDVDDFATSIALDSSENVFISGVTQSFGEGNSDMILVKFVEKSSESIIPGYNFLLLILLISVVSLITVISRFIKTNKCTKYFS